MVVVRHDFLGPWTMKLTKLWPNWRFWMDHMIVYLTVIFSNQNNYQNELTQEKIESLIRSSEKMSKNILTGRCQTIYINCLILNLVYIYIYRVLTPITDRSFLISTLPLSTLLLYYISSPQSSSVFLCANLLFNLVNMFLWIKNSGWCSKNW